MTQLKRNPVLIVALILLLAACVRLSAVQSHVATNATIRSGRGGGP